MKKIALLSTVLFASTAVFAGTISNNSAADEKLEINGQPVIIKAGGSYSFDKAAKVSYKGKTSETQADQSWEINKKGALTAANKQGASAAQSGKSPSAASASAAAPASATPASASQAGTPAPAKTSNQ